MKPSLLLDTSFLITLVKKERANHSTAERLFRHAVMNNIPMYFSSVVASEFAIKQPITDLPLGKFRPINFDATHGVRAAKLWNALAQRDQGDDRQRVRDDVKIIAQASKDGITHIVTDDESTLYKYCERLRLKGEISTRAIKLSNGFGPSTLSDDPQLELLGD